MWRLVVKRGKWKSRCSGENIHLLYYIQYQRDDFSGDCGKLTNDIEREKKYLQSQNQHWQ